MTPLAEAAQAQALVDSGYTPSVAAAKVGLAERTVYDIVNGKAGWAERKNHSLFAAYRQEQKGIFEHAMTQLTKKLLVRAEAGIENCSTYQAVGSAGLLFDKIRLLQGEPTSITASLTIQAVTSMDKLASMLGQSLVEPTDVSPNQTPQVADNTHNNT